jgi:porphobilinogen deaminase
LPVAAYGEISEGELLLRGLVISLDGKQHIRVQQSIPWMAHSPLTDAERLGARLAEQALKEGADKIIGALLYAQEQLHV